MTFAAISSRRCRLTLVGTAMLCALPIFAEDDPSLLPLPRWSEQELEAMRIRDQPPAGFGLLLNPDAANSELASPELADSPDQHQPATDLSRFLPQSLLLTPLRPESRGNRVTDTVAAAVRVLTDVSTDFIEAAEQAPAAMYLIDPNSVLHESAHEEFQHFLDFHARDARIRLHVLVIGAQEQLPEKADLSRIAGGSLSSGNSCLAVVPVGDPTRTRLFLSRDVMEAAKDAKLDELLSDVVKQALSTRDATEQFHRLLVRLSVRLFWLQNLMPVPVVESTETVRPAIVVAETASPLMEIEAPRRSWVSRTVGFGMAAWLAVLGFFGWYVSRRWHRHKYRTHEWTLPAVHVEPRLGGVHCGGAVSAAWS